MVKHISRQGVASVCLMSLNWCKTPRGRPEPSLSGSKQRVGEKYKIQWKYKNKYKYEYKYKWKYKSKSKIQKTRAHHIREQAKSGREVRYIRDCEKKVSRMKIVADKLIGPSGSEMFLCWLWVIYVFQ